jgi:hypothetical protein
MGYFVEAVYSDYYIPAENVNEAFKRLCALNDLDDIKRGGSYGGEIDSKSPRPDGLSYHPYRWFSWMDANYPETCSNLNDILVSLGFDIRTSSSGDVHIVNYNDKMGQEDIFLDELSDISVGRIEWIGEDGNAWITKAGEKQNLIQKVREFNLTFSN